MEKPEKDKPYSVIIFSYENNEYVSVCPRNWLNEDKKTSPKRAVTHRFMLQLIYAAVFRTNLKEAFAVEKPRQTASSSSDKRKITKNKKYRSPPSLPMKPIEEELNEIHADTVTSESSMECGRPDTK
ncbi:hypothetical protein MSG28_004675 [Choristoneura fumiferana]|uniref:Uncharacterized protein n=1 Tax=Choristoneura fumiferana TaxID=7141 RepID=A0ACC0K872_CHOFU|nr:hypothetical protein MSG28_004675 [Choristoneura fumiferana]